MITKIFFQIIGRRTLTRKRKTKRANTEKIRKLLAEEYYFSPLFVLKLNYQRRNSCLSSLSARTVVLYTEYTYMYTYTHACIHTYVLVEERGLGRTWGVKG